MYFKLFLLDIKSFDIRGNVDDYFAVSPTEGQVKVLSEINSFANFYSNFIYFFRRNRNMYGHMQILFKK